MLSAGRLGPRLFSSRMCLRSIVVTRRKLWQSRCEHNSDCANGAVSTGISLPKITKHRATENVGTASVTIQQQASSPHISHIIRLPLVALHLHAVWVSTFRPGISRICMSCFFAGLPEWTALDDTDLDYLLSQFECEMLPMERCIMSNADLEEHPMLRLEHWQPHRRPRPCGMEKWPIIYSNLDTEHRMFPPDVDKFGDAVFWHLPEGSRHI